jgi:hypothetical protein
MTTKQLTLEEVKIKGLNILYKNLGSVDFIRFLQQYENGYGDFTQERDKFQNSYTVTNLIEEIKKNRK